MKLTCTQKRLLREGKCPSCGNSNAYQGFMNNNWECPDKNCPNHSQKRETEVTGATPKSNIKEIDWDHIDPRGYHRDAVDITISDLIEVTANVLHVPEDRIGWTLTLDGKELRG